MKKVLLITGLLIGSTSFGQNNTNKLSVDFSIGMNKSFSAASAGSALGWNFPNFQLGARKMFTDNLGGYAGLGQEFFRSEVAGVDFSTRSFSLQFKGVLSLTDILRLNEVSPRLGAYLTVGPNLIFNRFRNKDKDLKVGGRDFMLGAAYGAKAQYKYSSKVAFNFGVEGVSYMMQNRTLDVQNLMFGGGFDGMTINATLGVNYYLGTEKEHRDWVSINVDPSAVAALKAKIEKAEKDMMDDDKDGVPNYLDQEAGSAAGAEVNSKGVTVLEEKVTDADGDGVLDVNDFCPTIKGTAKANGCPDADNDGVYDFMDKCPNAAGLASDNGCPTVKAKDKEVMTKAMKGVEFDNGKATISKTSLPILDEVAKVLLSNASYNLEINGHTDNVGDAGKNLQLSDDRAKAVKAYLMSKGVAEARLKATGYGDTQPKASNATPKGKAENRRVEFLIKFEQ